MRIQQNVVVMISLFIAILMSIVPVPMWAAGARPAWVVLVLIYWIIHLPYTINMGVAWFLGILLDMLNGTPLGEHALAMSIVAFLAIKFYRQLRVFPLWQQTLSIFLLIFAYQFILYLVQGLMGQLANSIIFLPSVISMILWPWLFVILQNFRRRFFA